MKRWTLVGTFMALALVACAESGSPGAGLAAGPAEVHVFDAWARSPMEDVAAVYFQAHNSGSETDALIAVRCPCAGRAEVHETTMAGGTTQMRPVERVELAPDQQISFEPGGYHVMLFDLTEPLKVGDFITITLEFERADPVTVDAEVRPYVPEGTGNGEGQDGMGGDGGMDMG